MATSLRADRAADQAHDLQLTPIATPVLLLGDVVDDDVRQRGEAEAQARRP